MFALVNHSISDRGNGLQAKASCLLSLVVSILFLCLLPILGHAQTGLPNNIANALKKSGFSTTGIGLYIQEVSASTPVVSYQANVPLNPASVVKLVTTAASLALLGSAYQWSTDVWYTGSIKNNRLNGDLYFHGNGDPYLTPERFWLLLNRVWLFGIKDIRGDVFVDNSYFKTMPINYAAFDSQPYRTYHVGPNALLIGFQATEFHFFIDNNSTPKSIRITPFPESAKIRIINKIKLVGGACGNWKKRLSLETKVTKGIVEVSFGGRFARACQRRTLYRRVTNTQDHFQHFFHPIWQQVGGKLKGNVLPGLLPKKANLAIQAASISLGDAIRRINKFSNNVMTRQVLLTLGAHSLGPPGTAAKGITAVKTWLKKINLDTSTLILDNGAGLSRKTRISAELLGKMLHFIFQQAYMPEFMASLPISGYDGAMAQRFNQGPLLGRAHIKTGLLNFVQTMAGYVSTASGKRYVVVLLHNDPRAHSQDAERFQDYIIKWIFNLK